ncbi:MAG: flagellar hook-basal body complex protein FliE [Candidatus Kapabacteria bacterium]|nr:flagellar hook-basal body complex protein FliE [Candidatus Kapabacteria bacterium]
MVTNDIELGKKYLPLVEQKMQNNGISSAKSESFTDTLKEFIHDVNSLQRDSADQNEKMIKGEPVDIHDVMITAEKAKTSFQLLMELRNKGLDLYHEVNRLQV